MVYPKLISNVSNSILLNGHNIVGSAKIKPLIIEKVIVKAKKSKDKDNLNESTEIYNEENGKNEEQSGSNEEIVYPN